MRRLTHVAVWAAVTLATGSAAADDVTVVLEDALWREGTPDERRPLTLRLRRDGEAWHALVMGHARRYNWGDHYGVLTDATGQGEALRLAVRMRIEADPWSETSGLATCVIELAPAAKGPALEGTWTGTFRGQEVRAAAVATVTKHAAGGRPPTPGETPRLLVRKRDIPALRTKAATDWGRDAMKRLEGADASRSSRAVGLGLLYVLTGEARHADAARGLIEADILDGLWNWTTRTYHDPAVRAVEGAIAYDLVRDACDRAFRDRMRRLMAGRLGYFYGGADHPLFNPNDGSNWSAMYRSGLGLCAVSLVDGEREPGPEPPAPAVPTAAVLTDADPGRGVPVVRLESGRTWQDWLFAGPLKDVLYTPALEPLGGLAGARPEVGTRVPMPDGAWAPAGAAKEITFAPLPASGLISAERAEAIRKPEWAGGVDVTAAMGDAQGPGTCYLYVVVENDRPGLYRVDMLTTKLIDPVAAIGGAVSRHGDFVRLGKGRVPVLVRLPVASKEGGFTNVEFYLKLHEATDAEAEAWLTDRRQAYSVQHALWQDATRRHEAGEPADPVVERWLGVARQRIENYADRALGEIGWNHEGEAYAQHSYRLVLPFAHAYRNVTGHELAASGKLNTCLLNYVGRTVLGTKQARMQAFGPGGGPLGVDNWARGFGLLDAKYRRYALWTWNRTQALADAGKLTLPEQPVAHLDPMSAAFRFVSYPLDVKAADPGAVRDAVCVDAERGGYVFRNRWRDDDDIAATVYLNSHFRGGGWNSCETGEFRLLGLGAGWAVRGMGFGNGSSYRHVPNRRDGQNVLLPPEKVGDGPWEAVATRFKTRPDGGGILRLNMDNVYTAAKAPAGDAARAAPVRPGAPVGYDLGLTGSRWFGADYSGACGAPGLFAVADTIAGSQGECVWQLVTEAGHEVTIGEATFTIRASNGATLRATVVAPESPTIEAVERSHRHEINYHGGHRRADFKRKVIRVAGRDRFLVVMTLQQNDAPHVETDVERDELRANIGEVLVRFDGKRLSVE